MTTTAAQTLILTARVDSPNPLTNAATVSRAAALTMSTVMFAAQANSAPGQPDDPHTPDPVTADEIWDFCAHGITSGQP